jgi:hypothetical protein
LETFDETEAVEVWVVVLDIKVVREIEPQVVGVFDWLVEDE